MNTQDLKQTLAFTGTTLTISHDTLGAKFGDLLSLYNGGQPLVITQAAFADGVQADGAIVLSGKASFANVADLPLTARFCVNAAGELVSELRYTVRGSTVAANAWKFSTSFPSLPPVYNSAASSFQSLLDSLDLYDSAFVVTSTDGQDSVLGVPLVAGINFVSHLRPSGILGVFEHAAASNPVLAIYGSIRLPKDGDLVVALNPGEHPWDRLSSTTTPPAAGIYLQAALDLGFQAGKVALSNSMLRIYSPISTDWMAKYPSFSPVQGYTATLSIPSAGIQVNLGADVQWGVANALLYGNFEGVTLGKLTHLLDLTGTDGLLSHLPSELQKPVDALEKLALTRVALDIVLDNGLPSIRTAFVTVGFPSLTWKVWKDDLVVESLLCRFTIFSPFAIPTTGYVSPAFKTRVGVTVMGTLAIEGVPLAVSASSDEGFTVRTSTLEPVNLGLDKLVKSRGPGVPVPSSLTLNYLGLVLAPGKYYSMDALLAGTPKPWTIPVGKDALTISDVGLHFELPAAGSASGMFSGTIALDAATLQMTYNFPGSLILRSRLPKMQLSKVISKLCDQPVKLPSGLDLTVDYSSILIQEQKGSMLFQLLTEIDGLGVLAFEARGVSGGKWGFAYGVDLSASSPSKLPALSALQALEKALHLQKFMLVVSSIDQPGFQFPDSAQFNNPALVTKKVALPGGGGVTAGLNVFAEWMLDGNDKQHKMLKTLLGLEGTLQVTIQVPENPANGTKLFVGRSGKLMGHPFQYKMGMILQDGAPSLFLTGTVTVDIQKHAQTFDLTTLFTPTGAFMSADMKGSTPIDCGPFKLSNLGLEVGVDFAGLPSLGITGNIDVKSFESSIAVFFDAANPAKSLIAGAVSDLTLKDVVDTLIGSTAKSSIDGILDSVAVKGTHSFQVPASLASDLAQLNLDKVAAAFQSGGKVQIPAVASQLTVSTGKAGEVWHLTDLTTMRHYQLKKSGQNITVSLEAQFYMAPLATQIGTISFPAGFFINGAIEFLGYHAEATITMGANKGISVDASMDKISIGKGGLFTLSSVDGKSGPKVSISTMAQPDNAVAEFRQPHFYINGAVQLLGLKSQALASISTKGMLIDLKGNLAPGVEFDLDVQCDSHGLSVDGDVKAGVGTIDLGALGKIKVNTDVEGSLGVRISAQQLALSVEASFDFLGEEKKIGKFDVSQSPDALLHLAETLTKKVEALLTDEFKDANRWANAMKNGAIDGVEDAGKVLTKVYGKSEKEAEAAAKDISSGAKSAEKAVTKTASNFGKKLKKLF